MKYVSTRGDQTERGFSEILLEGLAPDGGLYLPTHYPPINNATLTRWRGLKKSTLDDEKTRMWLKIIIIKIITN